MREIVLCVVGIYIMALALMLFMGRSTVGQLSPSDLVLMIIIGSAAAVEGNLSRARLSFEQLLDQVRRAGLDRLQDVEYAVLEPMGDIDIIPRKTGTADQGTAGGGGRGGGNRSEGESGEAPATVRPGRTGRRCPSRSLLAMGGSTKEPRAPGNHRGATAAGADGHPEQSEGRLCAPPFSVELGSFSPGSTARAHHRKEDDVADGR